MRYTRLGLAIALMIAAVSLGACKKKMSSPLVPTAAAATATTARPAASTTAKPVEMSLHGTVSRVDTKRNELTIWWQTTEKDRQGKLVTHKHWQTLYLKPTTKIMFEDKPLKLSQVKIGSTIDVKAQKTGHTLTAVSITVVREPAAPAPKNAPTTHSRR
jgi:hypothetical protein